MWYTGNRSPIDITKPLNHESVKGFVYLCKRLNIRSVYAMALLAQVRFEMGVNWQSSKAKYNNLWAMRPPVHRPKYYKEKYYQSSGEAGEWCHFETQFDALIDRIGRDINFGFIPPRNETELIEYISKVSQSGYATGSNNHYQQGWATSGTYIFQNFRELFETNLDVYPLDVSFIGGKNHGLGNSGYQYGIISNNKNNYDSDFENYIGNPEIPGEIHNGRKYLAFGKNYEMLPLPIFNNFEERENASETSGTPSTPPTDKSFFSDSSGIFETILNMFKPLFNLVTDIVKAVFGFIGSLFKGGIIGIIIFLIIILLIYKFIKK